MPHYAFPTRPPGICGAVFADPQNGPAAFPYPEAELVHSSQDGLAALGLTLRPPRTHLGVFSSADESGKAIGISMGVFYEESILEQRPYAADEIAAAPLQHCNGLFLAAGYAQGTLTIVTSPYGSYPLYFTQQQHGILFSTSIRDLLRYSGGTPQHRAAGIAQWILLDRTLDSGTVWQGIERFEAASIYTYTAATGQLEHHRYWDPEFGTEIGEDAIRRAADAYADAVHRIVGRAQGNLAAALTGGIDSRNIWSVLAGNYPDITAVTHYMMDGTDIALARDLASRLGAPHRVYKIGREFTDAFEESLKSMLLTTNGTPSAENAHLPHIYDYHTPWTDTLIDGINASLERNISMRRVVARNASPEQVVEATYRWLLHPEFTALLEPEARTSFAGHAHRAVEAHYALCDTALPPKPRADEFYIRFMEPNYRNDLALLQFYYNQFTTPFFDLHYTQAISAIRDDIRSAQRMQLAVFQKYTPGLGTMPRSHTDVRTLPVAHWKLQLLPLAWDRYIAVRLEPFTPAPLRKHLRLRRPSMGFEGVFKHYLTGNMDAVIRGVPEGFDRRKTEAYLRAFLTGEHADTYGVGRLIAMSSPWSVLRSVV